MTDQHPTELLPAYVLDALEQEEQQAVHAHLAHCPRCRAEAETLRASLHDDGGDPLQPRRHVREHLRTLVALDRARNMQETLSLHVRRLRQLAWTLSLAAAAAVIIMGVALRVQQQHNATLTAELAQQQIAVTQLQQQYSDEAQVAVFLADPATASHRLPATAGSQPAQATMFMQNGHHRLVLFINHLEALDAGHTYQFWFATDTTQVPALAFIPSAQGTVTVIVDAPAPIDQYNQVMVTVEPRGGAQHPSKTVVLATDL